MSQKQRPSHFPNVTESSGEIPQNNNVGHQDALLYSTAFIQYA